MTIQPATPRKDTRNRKGRVQKSSNPVRVASTELILQALATIVEAAEYREHCIKWQHVFAQPETQDNIRSARAEIAAYEALLDIQAGAEVIISAIRPDVKYPRAELLERTRALKWDRLGIDTETSPPVPIYKPKARRLASRNLPNPATAEVTAT